MTVIQAPSAILGGAVACGLNGKMISVPTNFTHTTVLVAGSGANATMARWGDALLAAAGSGKKRTAPDANPTLRRIVYATDNGAYYYYQVRASPDRGAHMASRGA